MERKMFKTEIIPLDNLVLNSMQEMGIINKKNKKMEKKLKMKITTVIK